MGTTCQHGFGVRTDSDKLDNIILANAMFHSKTLAHHKYERYLLLLANPRNNLFGTMQKRTKLSPRLGLSCVRKKLHDPEKQPLA
jgi:hypothetical protein